jgi:hypothetical protein
MGKPVDGRPSHLLWRMRSSGEMESYPVICDSEVERIVGMLTHPARFSADYAMLVGVRPLEDGRFTVWFESRYEPGKTEERLYDSPFDAARAFISQRRLQRLGHDFETGWAK